MKDVDITYLGEKEAEALMRGLNESYRAGAPEVQDSDYDYLLEYFAEKYPENRYFNQEEVESDLGLFEGKTVKLPERMLSTQKAYSHEEIAKWADNVLSVSRTFGMIEEEVGFRITPKLDGYAAFDDGVTLYTRGDGKYGTDITRAFDRGLSPETGIRGCGKGEIVVNKKFFEENLSHTYDNTRNVIAGVIKEGELDPNIALAIKAEAVLFVPFSCVPSLVLTRKNLLVKLEEIWDEVANDFPYDTDGLVIEAIDPRIKERMGFTSHHFKWQIAFKKNTEYHNIPVLRVTPQTSKSGRIIPVVELVPTKVSGVIITRATGHHYGNIIEEGICEGAVVRVCRSGLVIPYIESVVTPADNVHVPSHCPSCNAPTKMDGDNLYCTNEVSCPAQIEKTLEYFFKTLGNCDGFGPAVISIFCDAGITSVRGIYSGSVEDFQSIGISPGVAENLFTELQRSKLEPIEDWKFLAAFSIPGVGRGGCEKLLTKYTLDEVFHLSIDDLLTVNDFGEKRATAVFERLEEIRQEFNYLYGLGFNLIQTKQSAKPVSSNISGKTVVFTGTMVQGKRGDMEKHAKSLGAKVSGSVSAKTDYLVCGENVGATKTNAAKEHGVTILTENEYLKMIEGVL